MWKVPSLAQTKVTFVRSTSTTTNKNIQVKSMLYDIATAAKCWACRCSQRGRPNDSQKGRNISWCEDRILKLRPGAWSVELKNSYRLPYHGLPAGNWARIVWVRVIYILIIGLILADNWTWLSCSPFQPKWLRLSTPMPWPEQRHLYIIPGNNSNVQYRPIFSPLYLTNNSLKHTWSLL